MATVSKHLLDDGKRVATWAGTPKLKMNLENPTKMEKQRRTAARRHERKNCARSRRLKRTPSQQL